MKKVFLAMIATALSFGAFAQDTTNPQMAPPTQQPQQQQQPPEQQQKDMYVFKNNKMWAVKSGNITEMTDNVTLSNGTVVKTTGEIVKDGGTQALKDGQYIDVDGNIGETTEK
jgi:glucose/arabinose dehydrogenase